MEFSNEMEFTKSIKCQDAHAESSTEYILPDYLGDVRKILFTSASARPAGNFLGNDRVECSGILVYDMIYLDAEDNISSVQFTSDYDYDVRYPAENCRDAIVDTEVSAYSIRLAGPRKISARASVTGSVRLTVDEKLEISGDCIGVREDVELATLRMSIERGELSSVTERECAEAIARLDSAIAEEVSVIYSDARATADSVEYTDGAVTVKGKLRMSAVIKNGENDVFPAEKLMNFEESVPFEKGEEDMKFTPEITLTSLKASVNPCEDGCEVVLSSIMELSVLGEKNDKKEIITDGYLKSCASSNQYEELCWSELIDTVNAKGNHSASIPRSDITAGKLREILFLTAEPRVESVIKDIDGVKILGDVKYSGVASELDEEGSIGYTMVKFSSPFATNVNINCQNPDKLTFEAKVTAHGASASIDADNLYAACVLESSVIFCEEKKARILSSMSAVENEPYESCSSKITVYFPTADDTLFSVARRFHTSALKVAADNSLGEAVMSQDGYQGNLAGVKKLIIY